MTDKELLLDPFKVINTLFECWKDIDADETYLDKDTGKDKALEYAIAISIALEQFEYLPLITLLHGIDGCGITPPLKMLPLIAEVIQQLRLGKKDGVRPIHTQIEKFLIYRDVSTLYCENEISWFEAYSIASEKFGISDEQVKKIRQECLKNPNIPKYQKGINHPKLIP